MTLPSPVHAAPVQGFADLVDRVSPAVVQITAKKAGTAQAQTGGGSFDLPEHLRDGPFAEFFDRYLRERSPNGQQPGPGRQQGAIGSGFIIDSAGTIVTNNHVVGGATEINVALKDGRSFPAELVGTDEKTDLAVLKVKVSEPLPTVAWGDSQATRVGDWVLAVGNPFGLSGTVTAGIISARGRDIGSGPYDDFLQIDAPLNSGNSGGPLFNGNGQVVGVNTAIFSPNGGNIGIGFAIPSDAARKVVAELEQKGSVDRGWLGVSIQPLTEDIAQSLGLDKSAGALVNEVTPDSPASRAGFKSGDVVLSFAGKPIEAPKDLSRAVADTPSGATQPIKVWRGEKEVTLKATIGESKHTVAMADHVDRSSVQVASLGLDLVPVDAATRARLGLAEGAKGAVIARVDQAKDAARKGLRPGDLITQANTREIQSPNDVVDVVGDAVKAERKAVLLRIERDGEPRFVALELANA